MLFPNTKMGDVSSFRRLLTETKKIESIVGKNKIENSQSRRQEAAKIFLKQSKTQIKAKDILVGESYTDDKNNEKEKILLDFLFFR